MIGVLGSTGASGFNTSPYQQQRQQQEMPHVQGSLIETCSWQMYFCTVCVGLALETFLPPESAKMTLVLREGAVMKGEERLTSETVSRVAECVRSGIQVSRNLK